MGNLGSATDILYFNKVMSSTMHWPYLGVIIVQKIPSESLQYNSTTVFMTCNEMAATVSCRQRISHTSQHSPLPAYPPYRSKSMYLYGSHSFSSLTLGKREGPRLAGIHTTYNFKVMHPSTFSVGFSLGWAFSEAI